MLKKALERQGSEVVYQSIHGEYQLDRSIGQIAVAGGDGTLEHVFRRLTAHPEIPVLLLPVGSANNIARSLGLALDWKCLVRRRDQLVPQPFYYGRIANGNREKVFFESVGIGVFAELLHSVERDCGWIEDHAGERQGFAGDMAALAEVAATLPAVFLHITSAENNIYETILWMEVMNTRWIGPQLDFGNELRLRSPRFFQIMMILESQREALVSWLKARSDGVELPFPQTRWYTAEGDIRITWRGSRYHADDEALNADGSPPEGSCIRIKRAPEPLLVFR